MTDLAKRAHALYRFFNAAGTLLYIGITAELPTRLTRHADGKAWWLEVASITVEPMPGRPEALAAERGAIKAERPKYNVQHNGGVAPIEAGSPIVNSFVGSFFHGDVNRQWQGIVLEAIDAIASFYFVETFSWLDGRDYTRHVVHLSHMAGWRFYDSADAMREQTANVQALWRREADAS